MDYLSFSMTQLITVIVITSIIIIYLCYSIKKEKTYTKQLNLYKKESEIYLSGGKKMFGESFTDEIKDNWGKLLVAGGLGYLLGSKVGTNKIKKAFNNMMGETDEDEITLTKKDYKKMKTKSEKYDEAVDNGELEEE